MSEWINENAAQVPIARPRVCVCVCVLEGRFLGEEESHLFWSNNSSSLLRTDGNILRVSCGQMSNSHPYSHALTFKVRKLYYRGQKQQQHGQRNGKKGTTSFPYITTGCVRACTQKKATIKSNRNSVGNQGRSCCYSRVELSKELCRRDTHFCPIQSFFFYFRNTFYKASSSGRAQKNQSKRRKRKTGKGHGPIQKCDIIIILKQKYV